MIKLIYPIWIYEYNPNTGSAPVKPRASYMPLLALPVLKAFLKEMDIDCEQDDLNIKLFHHNKNNPSHSIQPEIFSDRDRVFAYLKGSEDREMDYLAEFLLNLTNFKGFKLIGFSLPDDSHFATFGSTLVLAKKLKERYGVKIVVGGSARGVHIREMISTGLIDFGVEGKYGELSLYFLWRYLEGKEPHLENIPALIYQKNGKICTNPIPPGKWYFLTCPNFDGLPLELYEYHPTDLLVKNKEGNQKYEQKVEQRKGILILPYQFVQGCVNSCIFCVNSKDPWYFTKSPQKIVEDLSLLSEKYRTKYFHFINSNFNPSYQFADELCERINKRGLKILWSDCANFLHIDKSLMKKISKAGAVRLIWGLETASPRMLKYIRKPLKLEMVFDVLKLAYENGIWSEIEIIAGMPTETEKDVQLTIDYMKSVKGYVKRFWLNRFMLMHDSKLALYPEKYGITNVRSNLETDLDTRQFKLRFDEIGGLPWELKVEQIQNSYNRIEREILKYNKHISIHRLFYLRSLIDKPTKMAKILDSIPTELLENEDLPVKIRHSFWKRSLSILKDN